MKYTHVPDSRGEYLSGTQRVAVIDQSSASLNKGGNLYKSSEGITRLLTRPWVNSETEFHYAIDQGLKLR